MPTTVKKAAPKTGPTFPSPTTRTLFLALVVLLRAPAPLIADQSTNVHQSFYYFQSNHDGETGTMDNIDSDKVQKQLQMWEAATTAQRHYVEAQGKTSAARLEKLRRNAELLTSAARAYHLNTMLSTKRPRD
ncbi:hypothetical protein [Pseudomonas tolaasii]